MEEFKPDIFVHGLLPIAFVFAGLMCFRFKAGVPGIVCWVFALGVFVGVARAHGIDALGAIIAIDMIWCFIFAILWGFVAILGFGVRATTRDLPSGDWRGGTTGNGPSRPRGEYKYRPARRAKAQEPVKDEPQEPIPQVAPDPIKPKSRNRDRFAMICKPPAKRR